MSCWLGNGSKNLLNERSDVELIGAGWKWPKSHRGYPAATARSGLPRHSDARHDRDRGRPGNRGRPNATYDLCHRL